jgi:hypothetical protein
VRIGLNLYQVSQVAERVGNWQKLSSGNETKAAGYDQWQHVGINSVNPAGWGTLVITEKRHQRT